MPELPLAPQLTGDRRGELDRSLCQLTCRERLGAAVEKPCLQPMTGPTWIVHAEKGDGGLTDDERRTLEGCPHAHLVTIPGTVFFLPNEAPERIADVILEAAGHPG